MTESGNPSTERDGPPSALRLQGLATHHVGPIDLEVGPGECVGLAGPSGSGKSLLLRAIADLDPHNGLVRLGSVTAPSVPAPKWRCQVGLLPAESAWWAERVGDHFPRGMDSAWREALGLPPEVPEWSVARLSTGERQRLALLRLLSNRPAALLLDEPTASLDAENTRAVEKLIADYRREHGAPVIWVSHDPEQTSRVADRVCYIDGNGQPTGERP